jgi:hypothetical protein
MGEDMNLKTYILQVFGKTDNYNNLIIALKYFMFDDKRNPLYIHIYENTIFLYTPYEFWNMNSISMMARSHLKGDYFILYEIDGYDGFLPSTVWEKKKDAIKYHQDKELVLSKYKRSYVINKIQRRSFLSDSGDEKPTVGDIDKKLIVAEPKDEVIKKKKPIEKTTRKKIPVDDR